MPAAECSAAGRAGLRRMAGPGGQLVLKQDCICSSTPGPAGAGSGKSHLEGSLALVALAVNLHFWRVPASNRSSDFPCGSE